MEEAHRNLAMVLALVIDGRGENLNSVESVTGVTEQNGIGQNGTDKMVRTKW